MAVDKNNIPAEKLSAVIITLNEIKDIERCIRSVEFADEIIVVDSFSSDGTWEWLQAHPRIRSVQHPFKNYTEQKSYALSLASNDWIYFLDADEVVPEALRNEILQTISGDRTYAAYWNYRIFMYREERLRFSGWQTDKVHRLFRKSRCSFTPNRIVHEILEYEGPTGILKEKLIHYSYKNYEDYKGKMLKYGQLKAKEAYLKGKRWTLFSQYFRPAWRFFTGYVVRLGFLDGKKGLVVCYLNALGVHERYKTLHRLRTQKAAVAA